MHRFDGYDIEVTQGDTLFFKVDLAGRDLPEGSVAYFSVKTNPKSDELLIYKKLNASDELLDIRLTSEDTNLPARTYYWDVRVLIPLEEGGYEVETPMEYAAFTILPAIGSAGDDVNVPGMDADLPVLSVLVKETRELYEEVKNAYESGQFKGEPGPQGVPGEDGVSPVVSSTAIDGGHRVTITDATGETMFDLLDGEKGPPGDPGVQGLPGESGADGFSPIVSMRKEGKVTTLTITDSRNSHVSTIKDGEDGSEGPAGPAGADGVSPTVEVSKTGTVTTLTFKDATGTKTATVNDGEPGPPGEKGEPGDPAVPEGSTANQYYATDNMGIPKWEDKLRVINGEKEHSVRTSGTALNTGINANGAYSFSEGKNTSAKGEASHAEGESCRASGNNSHAEGVSTIAFGHGSHAEGFNTVTYQNYSHAEGKSTIADGEAQHVQGKYNVEDMDNRYAHIVGNGKSADERSNAHTVDWNGNAWFKGKVYVGGTSQDNAVELGAGGGEYTPPDWGSKRVEGYLLPETTFTIDPETGVGGSTFVIGVTAGEQYTVKWNGTDFVCVATEIDLGGAFGIVLGNYGALTGGESTNEPFCIIAPTQESVEVLGAGLSVVPLDGSEAPVVSIYGGMEIVQKIDEKFVSLPAFPTIDLTQYGLTEILTESEVLVPLTEEQMREVGKAFETGVFWCATSGIKSIDENVGAKALMTVGLKSIGNESIASALVRAYAEHFYYMVIRHIIGDPSLLITIEEGYMN